MPVDWTRKLAAYLPRKSHGGLFEVSRGRLNFNEVSGGLLEQVSAFALGTMCGPAGNANPGGGNVFRHPLCSKEFQVPISQGCPQAEAARSFIENNPDISSQELFWQLWRYGREVKPQYALSPATADLPDFTIWNLSAAQSALMTCVDDQGALRPALLMFQMGPVQDFIAQARSTRDLWSGSYLLSWLIAHALKAIAKEIGPDSVIFPNLRGNALFDVLVKDVLSPYPEGRTPDDEEIQRRVTPTLPNRFLVLVPQSRAEELAKKAEAAIRQELSAIGDSVWKWVAQELKAAKPAMTPEELSSWRTRWDAQIASFPQIAWAWQEWLSEAECLEQLKKLPIDKGDGGISSSIRALLAAAGRNGISQGASARSGILWSAHYALVDAKLAARRNTREFSAWQSCALEQEGNGTTEKDSLSGKEEVIGDKDFWNYLTNHYQTLFTAENHRYGAMNLVKRLWCRSVNGENDPAQYLRGKLELDNIQSFENALRAGNVQEIAKGRGYYAVLAMDGDEMGKWVSGAKTPFLRDQMSAEGFRCLGVPDNTRRMLTPAYHLQFSEALSNFALYRARAIVENPTYGGKLIYAGGDDVLAYLPATTAISCAQALQKEFCKEEASFQRERATLLLPGAASTVSAGMSIGHGKAPMQSIIREAHHAESRAKGNYGRDAIAFSLDKRSGEIIQWGCKWNASALPLMEILAELMGRESTDVDDDTTLSKRFPYAIARQLAQYSLDYTREHGGGIGAEDMKAIMKSEVGIALERQGEKLSRDKKERLQAVCDAWLEECDGTQLDEFIKPFLTESFINRSEGDDR